MKPSQPFSQTKLTRRQFLRGSTVSAAAFMVVPGAVLGLNGATPPSQKLQIAGIGIGGQGKEDLQNVQSEAIVALCDVDQRYAAPVFQQYPNAKRFSDYRKMLEEMKDVDAVVIATPDHHHAFAAMEAIKRGKHVYCEKPLTHSVWEARQLTQAAREAKVATQMGNQGQASDQTRQLCELVWSGVIGAVNEAHIWTDRPAKGLFEEYWPQGCTRPTDTPPVPATLDWDLWLGPAPLRSFHPAYLPFTWRGWWDFGTGALGDMGCHFLDPVFRALKLGAPVSVQATSTRVNQETYPLGSMVTWQFPARPATVQANNPHVRSLSGAGAGALAMPPCKLVWYDGGLRPPRPAGLPDGARMGTYGCLLLGDSGFILGQAAYPATKRPEPVKVAPSLPRSAGHYAEWIAACKGGPAAGSNFDWAGPLTEAVLLGNTALRLPLREELTLRPLIWDAANLKFANQEEATRFLRRDYRPGWNL